MEWYSNDFAQDTKPITPTKLLFIDLQSTLNKLELSQRHLEHVTGIYIKPIQNICNRKDRISLDNLSMILQYLEENHNINWLDVVKFVDASTIPPIDPNRKQIRKRKLDVEPLIPKKKLSIDLQSVVNQLDISDTEIKAATGIPHQTLEMYLNETSENRSLKNISKILQYLDEKYTIPWTTIVRFEDI
ncbi:hypothetical protein [Thermoactinomyces sp. DSM 45892]|uniref:hypothetical protein n=1 Tax=Thermoactinomyces sp. DSM 45892 TaxID=1882753 RepID=UPI0008953F58|nr:hypothetical protein [Thermoactinomyces sp. DSM 45892]SDZ06144.1 hypothetical protein SAMN05444416_112123 [Thermoactinomyces sp. DSM 45892]